jgi:hypothetical protein
MTTVATGLRLWAQGWPADAAAVELLIRSYSGQYVRQSWPWVQPCRRPGWYWLDGDALAAHARRVTGERRRILTLTATLLGSDPATVALADSDSTSEIDRRAA